MHKFIVTLFLGFSFTVAAFVYGSDYSKNLLVIVTTDDPVTQLMAMVLATQTMKKGATVNVLLCGEAGSLALKDSPETLLKPNNTSPQMLLKNLVQNGVNVELCPPYLPNKEKTTADLIDGVSVAKPPRVADQLLHQDTRILSY
jgi:predicted peroxiredoxin